MNIRKAVESARLGKEEGMTWLYQTTYEKSYYIALKYMKQEQAAQDILQDSYIKAFRCIEQLNDAEKFPSWLGKIVAHTALDELKRKKPVLFTQFERDDDSTSFELEIEDDRIDTQPELAYDKKEVSEMVNEIVDTLSDEQRMCIMMYYLEQMSVNEIAETIGCSVNTVKSRLNYGRNNIKKQVEGMEKRGIKLYSVSPFMFFLLLLQTEGNQTKTLPTDTIVWDGVMENVAKTSQMDPTVVKTVASGITKAAIKTKVMMGIGIATVVGIGAIYLGTNIDKKKDVNLVQELDKSAQATEMPEKTVEPTVEPDDPSKIKEEALQAYNELLSKPEYEDSGFQVVEVNGLPYPVLIVSINTFQEKEDNFDDIMNENNGEESKIPEYSAVLCGYNQETKQIKTYILPYGQDEVVEPNETGEVIDTTTFSFGGELAYDEKCNMFIHDMASAGGVFWIKGVICPEEGRELEQVMEYKKGPSGDYVASYQATQFTTEYYNKILDETGTKIIDGSEDNVLLEEGTVPEFDDVIGTKLICYRNTEEKRKEVLK